MGFPDAFLLGSQSPERWGQEGALHGNRASFTLQGPG